MNCFRPTTIVCCAIALVSLFPPLLGSVAADTPDGQWFEECIGVYEPDADWFDHCADRLDSQSECVEWSQCFEEQHDFLQTRTCGSFGAPPCSPGEQPLPVQWFQNEVSYKINIDGSQDLHPGESEITDDVRDDIIASFDEWNEPDCTDFFMGFDEVTSDEPPPYYNEFDPTQSNHHVTFRDDDWQDGGSAGTTMDAVALTTVTFRPSSGEILSADIDLNTENFDYTNTDEPGEIDIDLRNTMTHEVGHFLGLDHSQNTEATMYRSADRGETKKRNLHEADLNGLCHIYRDSNTTTPAGGSGTNGRSDRGCACNATSGSPVAPMVIALSLLLVAIGTRRTQKVFQ